MLNDRLCQGEACYKLHTNEEPNMRLLGFPIEVVPSELYIAEKNQLGKLKINPHFSCPTNTLVIKSYQQDGKKIMF